MIPCSGATLVTMVVGSQVTADVAALWSRLDEIDGRLDEIVKLVSGLKTEIATVIAHVRDR